MADNKNFDAAKKSKNDEFYTLYEDIGKELAYYTPYFEGKHVYCNCDKPGSSCFWRYFYNNFHVLGLKKLSATWLTHGNNARIAEYDGISCRNMPLGGNGDFRSSECVQVLKESDIVVTNPPFSLFREYISLLSRHGKQFILVDNINAVTYKELFPLLKGGKAWAGHTHPKHFRLPDGSIIPYGNASWVTNVGLPVKHAMPVLSCMYYDNPGAYPVYDNYNAINVNRLSDIPCDYYGPMGVPVTIIDSFDPGVFDILAYTGGCAWDPLNDVKTTVVYEDCKQHNPDGSITNGSKVNTGAVLKYNGMPGKRYYTASNRDYQLQRVYGRIIIQRKC